MRPVTRDHVLEAGGRLAHESARLAALGWMRATSGNLSEVVSHDPLLLAITASGRDKGELRPIDIAVVDADGSAVHIDGLDPVRPSAEAGLHAHIAAVTEAGSVCHVHTHSAVLAAARWPDGAVLRDLEMLKALNRGAQGDEVRVPVIANSQDMRELGRRFDAVYDHQAPAVLVAGHGSYVWGADVEQARHRTEALDWLLDTVLQLS
jgi:methylthioribulose-1-phosphate dehydratase